MVAVLTITALTRDKGTAPGKPCVAAIMELQCYVLKRECAQKIVQFYFSFEEALTGKQVINYSMPLNAPDAFENNVLHGFGKVIVFPLFNHNVTDFRSKNIYYYNQMAASAIYSYEFLKDWWEKKGSSKSLEEIFENAQL